jgi:hypothetical protein
VTYEQALGQLFALIGQRVDVAIRPPSNIQERRKPRYAGLF